MSGHSNFTMWITHCANYVVHNGIQKKIKDTRFTSSTPPTHNSDEFMIELEDGSSVSLSDIDYEELSERHTNETRKGIFQI